MARQRRGGGFRPPELPLRGTLGTLLRTAAAQVGPLRDALERTAREGLREGRERLDEALAARPSRPSRVSGRRRSTRSDPYADALSDLGAIVLDLIRRGEIDLAELPEVRDIVAHLDELDAGADESLHDDEHDEDFAAPPSRNRFDSRRRDEPRSRIGGRTNDADDGTVSSKTWKPAPSRTAATKKPAAPAPPPRVWRPPVDRDDDDPPARMAAEPEPTTRGRPVPHPKDPLRKGGISFDDDEDLADYMHPDDVPPKPPKDGDS